MGLFICRCPLFGQSKMPKHKKSTEGDSVLIAIDMKELRKSIELKVLSDATPIAAIPHNGQTDPVPPYF